MILEFFVCIRLYIDLTITPQILMIVANAIRINYKIIIIVLLVEDGIYNKKENKNIQLSQTYIYLQVVISLDLHYVLQS